MNQILEKIYNLTHKQGFIYALLLIIRRDQTVFVSEYGYMNAHDRLITEEIGLLLRYWLKDNSNPFGYPASLSEISTMKHEAISLMNNLHSSFLRQPEDKVDLCQISSQEEMQAMIEKIFPIEQRIKEAIFYCGDSLYDFEYTDYLQPKYKYDLEWLKTNKSFVPSEVIPIIRHIKRVLTDKNREIPGIDENTRMMLEHPEEENESTFLNDFVEYSPFFTPDIFSPDDSLRTKALENFCSKVLNLFSIDDTDLMSFSGAEAYLSNFSFDISIPVSDNYAGPGYFNFLQTKPLLKYGGNRYLVALVYWLFMSAYEVPFYWLMGDGNYAKLAGNHRGQTSEEIAFEILHPVFQDNLYRDIVIKGAGKKAITDIDLLAVVGSVAICFQIKSKKLTEASKHGNLNSIRNDFDKAVVSALKQGAISRGYILNPDGVHFYLKDGNQQFNLPKGIKDVYVVCLTSENYPALSSQVLELADSYKESELTPIAFSIFDLRLIAYYLNTPFDFAYYIRQRIDTADYFLATTEMSLLGYHLRNKLWRDPTKVRMYLDDSFASDIDQNYYPTFANLPVEQGTEDRIANRWRNPDFEQLWRSIANHPDPRRTKVIFDLFDLGGDTIDELMSMIRTGHERVLKNGKRVAVTLVLDQDSSLGLSFIIQPPIFSTPLVIDMEVSGAAHKYQFRCNKWITLGRKINSPYIVDMMMVDEQPWVYNEVMENAVTEYHKTTTVFSTIPGQKIGRNEPCPCGSGKKYKNCHGK